MTISLLNLVRLAALVVIGACAPYAWSGTGHIYTFTDEGNVAHYSNLPYADPRYSYMFVSEDKARVTAEPAYLDPHDAAIAKIAPVVEQIGIDNDLDPRLLHAIIRVESGYNPHARSVKGAQGLMQLMPGTARRYGVRNPFDPRDNIEGGARYLKDLLMIFNNNLELALAGYNAGEHAVIRAGNRIPRYRETLDYVAKVLGFYRSESR